MAAYGNLQEERITLRNISIPEEQHSHHSQQGQVEDTHYQGQDDGENLFHVHVPPPDGGRHAWLFLAGCFLMEALLWGKSPNAILPSTTTHKKILNRLPILLWYVCIDFAVSGKPYPLRSNQGVFQEYYYKHQPFASSPAGVPIISTSASVSKSGSSGPSERTNASRA